MYKFKIWDKKEPINGCPAEKALEGRYDLQSDDVILIWKESNPYQILFMETAHGPLYQLGDTIDMTAQRQCNLLAEQDESAAQIQDEPQEITFSESQMEIVNQMINTAVQEAVEQSTQQIMARMSAMIVNPVEVE